MIQINKLWLEERKRKDRYLNPAAHRSTAFFGFDEIPAGEKVERVRRHFDAVAGVYDFMNTVMSLGIHYLWKRTAVGMMGLKKGSCVLDLCGGTGDLSRLASRAVGPEGKVVLCDINWAMMAAGRPGLLASPVGRIIRYAQGNAETIPFRGGTFDAAMVGFGIRNVTRMDRGLGEMFRVLKPGGTFMCLEFSKPANPVFCWLYDVYSFRFMPLMEKIFAGPGRAYMHLSESIRTYAMPEEFTELLERIGFEDVTWRRLTNGIAVVHVAKKP